MLIVKNYSDACEFVCYVENTSDVFFPKHTVVKSLLLTSLNLPDECDSVVGQRTVNGSTEGRLSHATIHNRLRWRRPIGCTRSPLTVTDN